LKSGEAYEGTIKSLQNQRRQPYRFSGRWIARTQSIIAYLESDY
jgi:hypothetical protein